MCIEVIVLHRDLKIGRSTTCIKWGLLVYLIYRTWRMSTVAVVSKTTCSIPWLEIAWYRLVKVLYIPTMPIFITSIIIVIIPRYHTILMKYALRFAKGGTSCNLQSLRWNFRPLAQIPAWNGCLWIQYLGGFIQVYREDTTDSFMHIYALYNVNWLVPLSRPKEHALVWSVWDHILLAHHCIGVAMSWLSWLDLIPHRYVLLAPFIVVWGILLEPGSHPRYQITVLRRWYDTSHAIDPTCLFSYCSGASLYSKMYSGTSL